MTPRPAAAGDAELPPQATESTSRETYPSAKTRLLAALDTYLDTALIVGSDDPSTTLELARVTLVGIVNTAVSERLFAVPLSETWTRLTSTGGAA